MIFSIEKETILFEFLGNDGPKRASVSIAGISSIQFLEKLISAICIYAAGKTNYTQRTYVKEFLNKLCKYMIYTGKKAPVTIEGWNKFILEFMRFYMSSELFEGSVRGKLESWQYRIAPLFDMLRQESIIPYEVAVPRVNIKTEQYNSSLKKTLRNLNQAPNSSSTSISKIVVDTSFAKNDADYIDHIIYKSRSKIELLKKTFIMHWNDFLSDHSKFNEMADEISANQLGEIINLDGSIKTVAPIGRSHLCSPIKAGSVNWAFAIVRHLLLHGDSKDCISLKRLRSLPYFRTNAFCTHDYKNILEKNTAMPPYAFNRLSSSNLLYRFAGLLSSTEIAVVCGLLIIEHPNFNPLSIANAKISSKNGKCFLTYTDECEKIIFSVDKPRAGTRKSAVLSELAARVISKVIELSNPIRNILKSNNDHEYEYLFLGVKHGGKLGRNTAHLTHNLTSDKGQSLCRSYPELTHNGLTRGVLSFRTIRNTLGVLRWFETGSIREMSRALGNSEKVVIESYLPPDILNSWNTRIIRRHQNILIILSSHNEKYLLEVTDFSTSTEMASFISQILMEHKSGTNALAAEVNLRLSMKKNKTYNSNGLLNIKLCERSLAFLYAYSDWAIKISHDHLDINSKNLIELSIFIKHTCESESISDELSNIMDINSLKKIHKKALVLKSELSSSISLFSA